MNQSFDPLHTNASQKQELQPYHVVYLVKRPAYEFIFAIPKTPQPFSGGKKPFFQLYFHPHRNQQGVVLQLDELQDFYESLSHLMKYLQIERQRRQGMD
jgi:hypothetical protein